MPSERTYQACAQQHFGLWAIEPLWFSQALGAFRSGAWTPGSAAPATLAATDKDGKTQAPPPLYEVTSGGAAIIPIIGQITKRASSFGGASSVRAREAIRAAIANPNVDGILLDIDSPGGTTAGTGDLADDLWMANMRKPVFAQASDLMASAAYWIGSQARYLAANASAEIGSIGTYAIVEDLSGVYDKEGVKVHIVSTGPYKGAFAHGTPVTDAQLDYLKERVTDANEIFLSAIKRGRKMPIDDVRALSYGEEGGKVWGASRAKELGLIDAVASFDDTLAKLHREIRGIREKRKADSESRQRRERMAAV